MRLKSRHFLCLTAITRDNMAKKAMKFLTKVLPCINLLWTGATSTIGDKGNTKAPGNKYLLFDISLYFNPKDSYFLAK